MLGAPLNIKEDDAGRFFFLLLPWHGCWVNDDRGCLQVL